MVGWHGHRTNRIEIAGALLLTVVGFGIGAHRLEVDSLWIDEMLTRQTALGNLPTLLGVRDHPPLLYLLTRLMLMLFGDNPFSLRLPSLFAGTLALPILVRFGREMGHARGGLWAALLLALSPFHLRHVQEARHYVLLLAVTAASYLLLYRALKRPNWRAWLSFAGIATVNLYVHYAALLVLLSQSILVALWSAYHLWQGHRRRLRFPAGAAALVALLYLPWLPRLLTAIQANVGANSVSGQGRQVTDSLALWFRVAFKAFNPQSTLLPYLLPLLYVAGMAVLWWRKRRLAIGLLGAGLFLPLLLIYLFPISREPYPRYIIYTLPFYLLPAGLALSAGLRWIRRRQRRAWRLATPLLALLLLLLYLPLVQAEYDFVLNDWLSVREYLRTATEEEDLLLAVSLEFPSGYNHVAVSLPYYLRQEEREYRLLPGGQLSLPVAEAAAGGQGQVWALFTSDGRPLRFEDPEIELVPFQTNIYLAHDQNAPADPWLATVELYQALLPLAAAPAPQCFLRLDLATLYMARAHYEEAKSALDAATAQCPERTRGNRRSSLNHTLAETLLTEQITAGNTAAARSLAHELLTIDSKSSLALEVLSAGNLLAAFRAGEVQIRADQSPEPVAVHTFTMPTNGDWGEVIMTHAPAAVSFALSLPEEPVALRTRVALAPQSWNWGGDGATFVAEITPAGGASQELFRKHVSNQPADRRWHEVHLSLASFAGQEVTLTLRTEPGPAGDPTGDWAGWETPRLLWETPS